MGLIAGTALVALVFLPLREYLTTVLAWARSAGPWGALIVTAIYVPACLFFIPGSLITLGAGFAFGVFWGFIAVSIGSILGATAAFLAGRTLLRDWIEPRVAAMPRFAAIDRAVGRQGFRIVLLARLSPAFPFNLLNYAFGLTSVSLRSYVLASWLGMLPGTLMYVYFGSAAKNLTDLAAGRASGGVGKQVLFAVGLIATIAVTVIVTRLARKALNEVVADQHASAPLVSQGTDA